MPVYVSVIGGNEPVPADLEVAEAVGRGLAERGWVLVCGGLGGVMEAGCRGSGAAGGTSIGLLPGRRRADANPFVTHALPTGLGEARNALVAWAADAVVAVGGELGTLSEIAFALKAGTPVVGIGTWELARPGVDLSHLRRAESAAEALALLDEILEAPVP